MLEIAGDVMIWQLTIVKIIAFSILINMFKKYPDQIVLKRFNH